MNHKIPILIVGLPRSGTTWFGEVLSSAHNTHYVFEPDNEALSPVAWLCKRDIHRYPYLTLSDTAVDYQQMWRAVIGGNRWSWYANVALGLLIRRTKSHDKELEAYIGEKTGLRYIDKNMHRVGGGTRQQPYLVEKHSFVEFLTRKFLGIGNLSQTRQQVILKSVHAPLSLDWFSAHFPAKVVLVLRNPFSIYASYKRLHLPDGFRNLFFQPAFQRDLHLYIPHLGQTTFTPNPEDLMAFQIMLIYKVIESQIAKHPEWMLVSHDRLCVSPHKDYRAIFDELGLKWSETTDKKIDELNKPGKGFDPKRISQDQPHKWKTELTLCEQETITRWSTIFNLNDFFQEHVNLK